MKHTIKLLTLTFTLVTILTLTGCPGPVTPDEPVTPDRPCTHEHTKTEVVEEATCIEDGLEQNTCVDCGKVLEEQKLPIDPENHDWVLESDTATCTEDGVKTYKCSHCDETRTENNPAHHTFIAGGCDKPNCPLRYYYANKDDYQIMVYVYSSVKDAKKDEKGKNGRVLYFSFPNDTTDIPQIVIGQNGPEIIIDNLIQMKSGYVGKTVKYFDFYSHHSLLENIDNEWVYPGERIPLKNLDNNSSISIVVE